MRSAPHDVVAAVDLGSNSFHMVVARVQPGGFHVIDKLKEMVRLAAGLGEDKRLSDESMQRAIDCLGRFGERVRDLPSECVRIVGTNTLRKARNARDFLQHAERSIGHPIDIISGVEEARLVYLGVAHSVGQDPGQRLVVDIGGGSTEVIIGRGFSPISMDSLYMGCVSASERFFPDGRITAEGFREAELAAAVELETIQAACLRRGWDTAVGSSGTINAIAEVARQNGWSDRGISVEALDALREALIEAGTTEELRLTGLPSERAPVFAGGVAVLRAVFEALGIKRMLTSDGAVREGLLHDLLGRFGQQDVREETIAGLTERYGVDVQHAERVEAMALRLHAGVAVRWRLHKPKFGNALRWAARLHEIGLAIAHAQYHRHGAYLLEHSDMPGFSREEQLILAALVRSHRRKFRGEIFDQLPRHRNRSRRLAALLRLAVVLHRSRASEAAPEVTAAADEDTLRLSFPEGWLASHPLVQVDLRGESAYLEAAGIRLRLI